MAVVKPEQGSVRVVAEPTVDNLGSPPMSIDLVILGTGRIAGRYALFGMQGSFGSRAEDTCNPFVLNPDGKIDFGKGYSKGERYAEFSIRDGNVSVGRLLTLTSSNAGIEHYRIARIEPLPLGSA